MKLLLAFAFVLVNVVCWSNNKKDSLISLINSRDKLDTVRLLALTELSYALWNINADSSYLLATEANQLAKKINNLKIRGRATRLIGIYFRSKGDAVKALIFYDSALQFSRKANDMKGVANAQLSRGLVYQEQGNYAKALDLDFEALHTFEQLHEQRSQGIMFLNIGQVHTQLKYFELAIQYFEKGIQVFRSINDLPLLGQTSESLAYVYGVKKNYPKAIEFHLQAKEILKKTRDRHSLTYTYNSLAEIYLELGQNEKALLELAEGLAIANHEGFNDRIADFKKTYAQYYNRTGQFSKALLSAEESQQRSQKAQHVEMMRNATEQKFIALKNGREFAKALEAYQLFTALKDSIQNQENRRSTLAKEFAFHEEKLKVENESLAKEAELRRETLVRTKYFLIALLIFSFIAGTLAIRYYRSLHRNKKLATLIKEQNEEIQAQLEELVQANEEIVRTNENLESQVRFQTNQILSYAFQNAHRVRGPLARIMGLIYLIEKGMISENEIKSVLEKIMVSAKEMDEVVREINQSLETKSDISETQFVDEKN
ncbi:MAG: hypothetical protein OJF59_001892 [Cytophagales bacterium]|jgi:tetratricopeptide (TPR) repeat protein|nr:MAG: hypothetical protein OJF59_001892 [Cytophagales bacterium]